MVQGSQAPKPSRTVSSLPGFVRLGVGGLVSRGGPSRQTDETQDRFDLEDWGSGFQALGFTTLGFRCLGSGLRRSFRFFGIQGSGLPSMASALEGLWKLSTPHHPPVNPTRKPP